MMTISTPDSAPDKFEHSRRLLQLKAEPAYGCRKCPRLRRFLNAQKKLQPEWWNGPAPTWADEADGVRLLLVGLAPGLKGANRTGIPFTGDASGELLYATLQKFGFASGHVTGNLGFGTKLHGTAITNAVRCVPPENKPIASEINQCSKFLTSTINKFQSLQVIVTLGGIAHSATIRALGHKPTDAPFAHGATFTTHGGILVVSSYHCSRYNVNTGRLTVPMFEEVFAAVKSADRRFPGR
jgi:uracil-DNA glycosylase family 4